MKGITVKSIFCWVWISLTFSKTQVEGKDRQGKGQGQGSVPWPKNMYSHFMVTKHIALHGYHSTLYLAQGVLS